MVKILEHAHELNAVITALQPTIMVCPEIKSIDPPRNQADI